MSGIGIILNPYSKKHKKDPDRMQRLSFIVGDKGSCKETSDLGDLRRVAEEFKTRDIEILGIGGGDGTIHVVLSHLIKVYGEKPLPKISFLKGGTLNTLATACGIKGTPEKIISNLIYKYHEEKPFEMKEMKIIQINDTYGFIFGIGVIARFMKNYYAGAPSPGRAAWCLICSLSSALFNTGLSRNLFERFDARVTVDGKSWPFKNYSAIYAGSVDRLGLGARVFHYSEVPGKFHGIGFSTPPRNILRHVPRMFMGKAPRCDELLEQAASEMNIQLEEPQPYTIDGEMLPPIHDFSLKTGPCLQIIVN